MRSNHSILGSLVLLAGCTLATDAGDRSFTDRLDFDFTLTAMSPHRDDQLDVALVIPEPGVSVAGPDDLPSAMPKYRLQARARILVPTDMSDSLFPDITMQLRRSIQDVPLDALFYVDTVLDNTANPLDVDTRQHPEHSWIRKVPPNGELAFYHEANFENFYDTEIIPLGTDIVLDIPAAAVQTPARLACLDARLSERIKDSFDVHLVFNPDSTRSDKGLFKMYKGNSLPTVPIRLEGIADTGSQYEIDVFVDGVRQIPKLSAPASATGLVIPFEQWFPLDAAARDACLAL